VFPDTTDVGSFNVVDCKDGHYQQSGQVKFYCGNSKSGALTVDQEIQNWTPASYGNGDCLTGTGGLQSKSGKRPPKFWNLPAQAGPANRTFRVDQTCCPCGQGPVDVKRDPGAH
jgi:hypothetical protein